MSASVHDDSVFEHSTMGPTEAMISEAIRVSKVCSACGDVGHCSYNCSTQENETKEGES